MKQKDIVIILVVVVFSAVVSFVLGRLLFAPPAGREQKVEVVDPISTEFIKPDTAYYNTNSINPTQLIRISENTNAAPFNGQ